MNAALSPSNYLNIHKTLRSWLLTTDHKRAALLYAMAITFFFAVGGVAATMIRLELLSPAGNMLSDEMYNRMFTLHGVVMVWFFLIPSIPATLGNFFVPLMIGAHDVAFPRLNIASWYLFVAAGFLLMTAVLYGGLDTGWTFYTPYSTSSAHGEVLLGLAAVFVSGFSSILTGLNFIVTIHKLRAPGMTWWRLPLFIWSTYATSLILVLATPVLAMTLVLLALERIWGVGLFDPALGGDPILFQHLFWFYSHPAVYIMVLPAMGVVSELIATFSRNPIFGYKGIAVASLAIALYGFLVWGHHMFVSSQSVYANLVFSFMSFLIAVPSAVKVFNWTGTLFRGSISLTAPMLYALGFIGLFTVGGMTGLVVASLPIDVHVHDTYFIVAHFHYIMVGGAITAYLGGLHYWWPKITGRLYHEGSARLAAILVFLGFNLTFMPQFIVGYLGMPRRYHTYPPEFRFWHILSTTGAGVLAIAYGLPVVYLMWSLFRGKKAGSNPWDATGLEWQTPSPPPRENFATTPLVTSAPYQYREREVST